MRRAHPNELPLSSPAVVIIVYGDGEAENGARLRVAQGRERDAELRLVASAIGEQRGLRVPGGLRAKTRIARLQLAIGIVGGDDELATDLACHPVGSVRVCC